MKRHNPFQANRFASNRSVRVCLKRLVLFGSIFLSAFASATERLALKESGHDSERRIVACLYAKDIQEAQSLPTHGGATGPTIAIATLDLNRDGKPEIFTPLIHASFCGSRGRRLVVLSMQRDGDWKEIALLISYGDIEVHDDYKNDYRTLAFDNSNKTWIFQNSRYQ